ncbi:hypothetical protein RhiirA4_482459 [Rhizophagus irregularis]|uniref:Uncharacterized protein n=1 Tax=Rhizophagus irregularis TaxID=588596 RepID=A0A2I1HL44_9GLOM|nr:hypothetical protein RhiirA4_482459 [Rhizophagus irregularis]
MDTDPEVLDSLQEDAKTNANHQKYIAVFVSSKSSILKKMQSRSNAWSRAEKPIEIGDLTKEKSLNYLINKCQIKTISEGKINITKAEKIYELVGGRIVYLQSIADQILEGQDFEDIKKEYFIRVENEFRTAKLLENYKYHKIGKHIIKALLDSKKLSYIAYEKFFEKPKEANKILESNVFTYHPETNTVTFQSQLVKCYIQENANIFLN